MTRVVDGRASCTECGAVWRVVHVTLSEEGCVRCGGDLEPLGDRHGLLEMHERERRFAPAAIPPDPVDHALP